MRKWFILGFFSGAAIGGLCGLLTAPLCGTASRNRLREATAPTRVKLSELRVNFKAWVDSKSEAIRQAI